jgi:hypothetical protein
LTTNGKTSTEPVGEGKWKHAKDNESQNGHFQKITPVTPPNANDQQQQQLFPLPNDFLIDLPPRKVVKEMEEDGKRNRVILLPAPPKGRQVVNGGNFLIYVPLNKAQKQL